MSLYYGIHTEADAKEEAIRSRRQKAEAERKIRILDERVRTAGKDLAALERQIEEKRSREALEKQQDYEYVLQSQRASMLAREYDQRNRTDKINVEKALKSYQKNFQRFEDRREYDLNRKDAIQNAYPARLHDEDPRLTTCGMQIFAGEDLSNKQRIINQDLERKAWLDAQIQEKREAEEEFRKAERIYAQRVFNSGLRSYELMKAERDAQRAVSKALADFNCVLAHEIKEKQAIMKQAEDEADMAHKLNMYNSELLTETTDVTSVNGPHKTMNDRFKGFGPERTAAIREHQHLQIIERQRLADEERVREKAWQRRAHCIDVHSQLYDISLQKQRREKLTEFEITNAALSREQRMREEYRNRILYTQTPSEDYFAQFQTSSR